MDMSHSCRNDAPGADERRALQLRSAKSSVHRLQEPLVSGHLHKLSPEAPVGQNFTPRAHDEAHRNAQR